MRNRDVAKKWLERNPKPQEEPAHGRQCHHPGCGRWALESSPFCDQHIFTAEGVQIQREIIKSAKYLVDDDAMTAEAARERERKILQFERRVRRGDFNKLLDLAMTKVLDTARANQARERQIAMLRFAMVKAIALEEDPHKMALSLSRTSNAISRAEMTQHLTQDPKPVVKYGEEWTPPIKNEDLVKYIWRHRPKDFEERYMAKITDGEEFPANLFRPISEDFNESREYDKVVDESGKLLPPVMPIERLKEIDERAGISREYPERRWDGKWVHDLDESERLAHAAEKRARAERLANGDTAEDYDDLPF